MWAKPLLVFFLSLRIFLSGLVLTGLTLTASADFESASAAYQNQNYSTAFAEFSQLAETGDPRAQTVLAIMYKYGESVTIDLEQSYNWYLKAAIQSYPPAQYNVGTMLSDGLGIAQDSEQAVSWFRKAADSGYERANDRIKEVSRDQTIKRAEDVPITWSQSWNLRLPNNVRDDPAPEIPQNPQVIRVQIGAMNSIQGAERLWRQISEDNSALLTDHQPIFREGLSGEKSIYRVQLGSFGSESEALTLCESLKASAAGCLVVLTE